MRRLSVVAAASFFFSKALSGLKARLHCHLAPHFLLVRNLCTIADRQRRDRGPPGLILAASYHPLQQSKQQQPQQRQRQQQQPNLQHLFIFSLPPQQHGFGKVEVSQHLQAANQSCAATRVRCWQCSRVSRWWPKQSREHCMLWDGACDKTSILLLPVLVNL